MTKHECCSGVIQLIDVEQLRNNGAPARSPDTGIPSRAVIIQMQLDLERAAATTASLGGWVIELESALVQSIVAWQEKDADSSKPHLS